MHGKAAQTILHRFASLFPGDIFPSPERVLQTPRESIRSCGFSGSKTAGILDVCRKTVDGVVPSRAEAESLSDEELIARLTAVRGVGRWTVEMLLIFSLGRPDVLPVDDFGVREGFRILKGLPAQPKPKELAEIGTAWAPFRSAAAWYLWRAADFQKEQPKPAAPKKPVSAKPVASSKSKQAAPAAKPAKAVKKKGGGSAAKKSVKRKDSRKR